MNGVSSVSRVGASGTVNSTSKVSSEQLRIYGNRHSEGPVQPVDPVTPVKKGKTQAPQLHEFQLPTIRKGADPVEMAVRSRIVLYDEGIDDVLEEKEADVQKNRSASSTSLDSIVLGEFVDVAA